MTKSWWSDEPGKRLINALNPESEIEDAEPRRLPVTWWTVAIVVLLLAAFIGLGIYLLADTANTCKDGAEFCNPNR